MPPSWLWSSVVELVASHEAAYSLQTICATARIARASYAFLAESQPGSESTAHYELVERRSTGQPRRLSLRSVHGFFEGCLEVGHFFVSAYGDTSPVGHHRPHSSDHYVLLGHGCDYGLCRALGVQHEAV